MAEAAVDKDMVAVAEEDEDVAAVTGATQALETFVFFPLTVMAILIGGIVECSPQIVL
jgi:hypothetical protein